MRSGGGGYELVWTGNGYRLIYVGGGFGNGYGNGFGYGGYGYGNPYGQCKHTVQIIVLLMTKLSKYFTHNFLNVSFPT